MYSSLSPFGAHFFRLIGALLSSSEPDKAFPIVFLFLTFCAQDAKFVFYYKLVKEYDICTMLELLKQHVYFLLLLNYL